MNIYDDMKVEIALGDLVKIHAAADCLKMANLRLEAAEKEIDETNSSAANIAEELEDANERLKKECEAQAREINNLRCELSTRPATIEFQPVTKTAINNAKDVLNALYRPITSEEDAANESVPGDRFQSLYKTLRDLVKRLEQEGLA